MESQEKYQSLATTLKRYGRVAVAFSGGVDSTLLLHAAREVLGGNNVFVMHGSSELVSGTERNSAFTVLDELGVDQEMRVEVEFHPLSWPEFVTNTADRCYFCKKRMYQRFLVEGLKKDCAVLLDGSNVDDLKERRLGFRAIQELGVETPLLDSGLSKKDIRFLACEFQLSTHDKASNSCLATRFSEGVTLERKGLELVEKCEEYLSKHDFSGYRVQPTPEKNVVLHVTARDMERLTTSSVRFEIIDFFKSVGFCRVLVDMEPRR
ncbi:MAG: ATP-dependent sacrificial sulfur transferase LarE [Desulfocapsa sp.]|nr:ATP-dependent sacrificial sulfur transferase LarE [Desulfocapsa sp.]